MKRLIAAVLLYVVCSPLSIPPEPVKQPLRGWQCLAWVVHDEARGESLRGARAVLDVVLARMKSTGKTACEIIAQPKQFSGYNERAVYLVSKLAIGRYIVVANMKPVVRGCKFFHAVYVSPAWATKMKRCAQIGRHIFYKEK